MFIVWSILLIQNLLNFLDYFFLAAPELIRAGLILEVSPEALDRVQFSTVSRQPDAHYPMLKEAQGCQRSNTFVVRSTIQNQDEATGWILFDQQVLQKGNESFAVLPLGNHPFDVVVDPVIGAKNVAALFLLTDKVVVDKVSEAVKNSGLKFEIISTNLSDEQEAKLKEDFGA